MAPVKEPIKDGFHTTQAESEVPKNIQLPASARNPQEEEKFLNKFKAALASKNKRALESLYYFENVQPEVKQKAQAFYGKLFETNVVRAKFKITPDNEAAQYNTPYTVPYLGKVKVIDRTPAGEKFVEIPVGMKDGHYYLTIGK